MTTKTPITDAINAERYSHHSEGYSALLEAARRLERDRAALMLAGGAAAGALDAASFMLESESLPKSAAAMRAQAVAMLKAISDADSNFPTESHE